MSVCRWSDWLALARALAHHRQLAVTAYKFSPKMVLSPDAVTVERHPIEWTIASHTVTAPAPDCTAAIDLQVDVVD